jgi:hypothetical protein
MPDTTDKNPAAAGHAALSICESLLLALGELKVLGESDVRGILEDAAATHRGAANATKDAALQRDAAKLIEQVLATRKTALRP